jgi:hypothetical protein
MKTLKQKQLEFLENTIKHFNSSNRGIDENGCCSYKNGCAIGRHLQPELAEKLDRINMVGASNPYVFNKLPKSLKELGRSFLLDIQRLHDDKKYWNLNGLSDEGKLYVEQIKIIHELKQEDSEERYFIVWYRCDKLKIECMVELKVESFNWTEILKKIRSEYNDKRITSDDDFFIINWKEMTKEEYEEFTR